jgi:hypothetical protein
MGDGCLLLYSHSDSEGGKDDWEDSTAAGSVGEETT